MHPYLAPAAAVIARWMGRESMHAGAFAAGGQALGVVGTREAGKSSTLAWLAQAGVDVLCDDMLIVDGDAPLVGPAIDRPARRRGRAPGRRRADRDDRRARALAAAARPARRGGRSCAAGSSSRWGDRVAVRSLPAAERLPRLAAERGLRLPPARPDALLELTSLPAWELSRPRDWGSLPEAADRLLELATARPTGAA